MKSCKAIRADLRHTLKQRKAAEKSVKHEADAIRKALAHRSARVYWMTPTATSRRITRVVEERVKRHTKASGKLFSLNAEVVNLREAIKSCSRKGR